jgi:hypothetical protein
MILLKPTQEQLNHVLEFTNAYQQNGYGKNVLGVSYDEYISFIRIGKLCELVFANYLTHLQIEFIAPDMLKPHPGNHKKGADLVLPHSGQEVDIKAANKSFHKRILIREDQFQAHVHDIYIGAKYCSDNQVEFYGYSLGADMLKVEPKDFGYGFCRYMMLDELNPIEEFIRMCQKKITRD